MLSRIIAAGLLLPTFYGLLIAGEMSMADLRFGQVETEVSYWGREGYHPRDESIAWVNRELAELMERQPLHPDYRALEASAIAWQAYWQDEPAQREHLNRMAVDSQFVSVTARPAHQIGWEKLETYILRSGERHTPLLESSRGQLERLQSH